MLRPEQVTLSPARDGGTGTVRLVDYAGAACSYALTLHRPWPGLPGPLTIRQPGLIALPDGTAVDVAVIGAAHVFPAE